MLQVIDWLNENEHRAFPLIRAGDIPTNFLLDLQLVFNDNTLLQSAIYFKSYRKISTNLEISFGTLSSTITSVTITSPQTQTYPLYIRNSSGNLFVFGEGAKTLFSSASTTATNVNLPVEPSVCYQFNNAWLGVSGISAAPNKKTLTNSKEPELPLSAYIPPYPLVGDVYFLEGYNFRVEIAKNAVDLEIGKGYGLKMSCDTYFLPEALRDCSSLVSYINGVPPDSSGSFTIIQGADISITPGNSLATSFEDTFDQIANQHSLFVGLTFQKNEICGPVNITPSLI